MNPRRLFTSAVFTSSRRPAGSQKKSTSGTFTLGVASPSQNIWIARSRSSFWIGSLTWLAGTAKWIIVITAGPLMSATTTRFEVLNRAESGFSIQSAFSAFVRPDSSLSRSSSPGTWPRAESVPKRQDRRARQADAGQKPAQ